MHLRLCEVGEISLKWNTNQRRHRSSSSSFSSRSSSLASHRRSKRSKRSKHSHKRRGRRSTLSSSSFSSSHSINDYGRYKRTRQSPQVADNLSMLQPAGTMDETPIIHSDNVQQSSKDTGSESEAETWSFDRAINEVFWLLPQELCPKTTEVNTTVKPLSGVEHWIESSGTPLLVLPQPKVVEKLQSFYRRK